jgi:Fe2+ or Zn2+ uptake regulation protein
MQPVFEDMKKQLEMKGINLSYQRMKILEYLALHLNHPTADQIFIDLQENISTLSKTTVYNTLRILEDAGLVRLITIEDNEVRYDIVMENHGHFKCESCGTIYNFRIDMDSLTSEDLNNFRIRDRNVYFKGTCQKCLMDIGHNE